MKSGKIACFSGTLLALAIIISSGAGVSLARSAASISVERPRCEYKADPLGIDVTEPRLSWIVNSDRRGQMQSAYRILVASSREKLGANAGDLWDSGKAPSDRTAHVVYRGKPLESGVFCFWKVMVWDGGGSPSAWSEPATWSMGLLDEDDWQAEWIGLDAKWSEIHNLYLHSPSPAHWDLGIKLPSLYGIHKLSVGGTIKIYLPCPYLRKSFETGGRIKRATVHATALGAYELHLNGERVGDEYFSPGWTDYNIRVYYQTYDVTGLVRAGDNVIGAILSDGWYAGNINMHGQRYYGTKPRFRARLHIEYADGSSEAVVTDRSWKTSRGPILEADMQAGEVHDAREEMPGWDAPGFDDDGWESVDVTDRVDALVEAHPGAPVRVTQEIRPIEMTEPKPGVYVFNLGQNFAGWARLKVSGEAGDKVTLRFAEMLKEDGNVYTTNLRTARATDTYILKGDGEEVWAPRFTFHGFQYVEVTGYPGEPDLDSITGIVVHTDLAVTGSLETSSPLVNKLYSNIVWGQRSNYLEVPTDCPQRDERLGWTGDAQVFIRTATYNMDVAPFFTKWLVDLEDGQDGRGRFPVVAPNVLPIPPAAAGWSDAGVVCPWTIYLVYGDKRVLERHYDSMVQYIDFLEGRSRGYISPPLGTYGDWLNIDADTPLDLIATAYFGYSASLMAETAEALGKDDDASYYRELFENIRDAFSDKFVDDDGRVKGDTQTAYLMALGYDLLTPDKREMAAGRLVDRIEDRDWMLSTGFLGLKLLLPTLTEIGRTDVAYRLLENREYPSWGYSIDQGATTVWERWNSYTIEDGFASITMNSFNHYAYGSVGEWMFGAMAGIDTDGPGFKKIIIRPRPGGDITWVKAGYDSIRGKIISNWRVDGGRFKLDVTIPANATAKVYLPTDNANAVTEGGGPISRSGDVSPLGVEDNSVVLGIGSGTYRFEAPYNH